MSDILINIKKENLVYDDYSQDELQPYVIEFVVGMKSLFSEYISENYDINYKNAMSIVKIDQNSREYKIGIKSPEFYYGKTREIVNTLLKYDLGSVSEKIQPMYILKDASAELMMSYALIWNKFIKNRTEVVNYE